MQTWPTWQAAPHPYTGPRTPRMILENCPICGGGSASTVGVKDGLRVLRCATCTVQYSERAPEVTQRPGLYNKACFHVGSTPLGSRRIELSVEGPETLVVGRGS